MILPGRLPLPGELSPRRRRPLRLLLPGRIAVGLLVLALVAAGGATVVVHLASRRSARRRAQAETVARTFADDWKAGDLTALAALTTTPSAAGSAYAAADAAIGRPVSVVTGTATGGGGTVRVPDTVEIDVPGLGDWTYSDVIEVEVNGARPVVEWTPATVVPGLPSDDELKVTRTVPARAPLLSSSGTALPQDADLADVLGATAPATAAQAQRSSTLRAGDEVGTSGVEQLDDAQLRGTASGAVDAVDDRGTVVTTLHRFTGAAPRAVTTTVDLALERQAEADVAGATHPTAIVAIDTRTGGVLAAASDPSSYPLDVLGHFPPGSTFKIVTLTAALASGQTLTSPVDCSPDVDVDGYDFRNASHESFGTITLEKAFAISCNTAFIHLAESLPAGALAHAASLLGCDTGHAPLDVPSYGCSYPSTATGTGYAASAIGQGDDLTSPLAIASIAAAIDDGTWQQPHVTGSAAPTSQVLPAAVLAGVRTAMRDVVTSGTGTPADLAGTPVFGKTGTAEYGAGPNPPTDAWFAAYRGDVAVAVVVEDGGFGEAAAAPIAARFLAAATP